MHLTSLLVASGCAHDSSTSSLLACRIRALPALQADFQHVLAANDPLSGAHAQAWMGPQVSLFSSVPPPPPGGRDLCAVLTYIQI